VSTDELTGVQALERNHPGLPLAPGKVERREFEYVRHGTRSFILSRDVVTGQIVAPACGPTRTEADFLAHLQAVVATHPEATRWHIVCDQLNTHQSESLVRWVADLSNITEDLGVKGESGILASMVSRAAFLSDPSHHVVFHYTPKHSRLSQSGRDLAFDSRPQAAQTGLVHLCRRLASQGLRLYRLLQSHDGQTIQVDLSREGAAGLDGQRMSVYGQEAQALSCPDATSARIWSVVSSRQKPLIALRAYACCSGVYVAQASVTSVTR